MSMRRSVCTILIEMKLALSFYWSRVYHLCLQPTALPMMGIQVEDFDSTEENENVKQRPVDGYDHAMGPCRFLLRLLGAWPDPYDTESDWTTFIRFSIVTMTMFLFATVSQTIKLVLCWKDLNIVTKILTNCNIPTSIATVKIASIWYYRYVLKNLVLQILEDWKTPHDEHELAIMWRSAKISRFFSIGCIFMTEGTLLTQCVVGFFEPISYAFKSNITKDMEWPLYMLGSFPYDIQASPNYQISIIGQFLSNVFASTSFTSADSFFIVLMFHLIGQLSILKLKLLDLLNGIEIDDKKNEFMGRLEFFHMKHKRLWRFSMAIEDSFNMMFLIQMVPCIFALCTQGYQLIMITEADSLSIMELIFMIYFLVLFLFTIFTYCYVAEILRQKSMDLSHAAYECDWTILPTKEARLLVLVIIRAQHPFEITAGKFASFSLQLYCRILKTSAGYLSMLLAVKDRMVDQPLNKMTI